MAECSVCVSDQLEAVNAALKDGLPLREVARRFSSTKSAVHRHKTQCIPAAEIRRTALARRTSVKDAQVVQSTIERLAPVDSLAGALMDFIQEQVERGKVPNLSLVKTFLQAQEIGLKAQSFLEKRGSGAPQGGGPSEDARNLARCLVPVLQKHAPGKLPDILRDLGIAI